MAKLKKCPFCGADARTDTSYYHDGKGNVSPRYYIRCSCCGCKTRDFVKESGASDAWNRRTRND